MKFTRNDKSIETPASFFRCVLLHVIQEGMLAKPHREDCLANGASALPLGWLSGVLVDSWAQHDSSFSAIWKTSFLNAHACRYVPIWLSCSNISQLYEILLRLQHMKPGLKAAQVSHSREGMLTLLNILASYSCTSNFSSAHLHTKWLFFKKVASETWAPSTEPNSQPFSCNVTRPPSPMKTEEEMIKAIQASQESTLCNADAWHVLRRHHVSNCLTRNKFVDVAGNRLGSSISENWCHLSFK